MSNVQEDVRALELLEDTGLYAEQRDGAVAAVLRGSGVSWEAYSHVQRVVPYGEKSYGTRVHFYIGQPVALPEGGW